MNALGPSYATRPYGDVWPGGFVPDEWKSDESVPWIRPYDTDPLYLDPQEIGAAAAGGAFSMGVSTGIPGVFIGALAGALYEGWGWKKGAVIGGMAGLLMGAVLGAAGGVVATTERTTW